jgi:uncharacterized protein YdeI (YjbR/CyaY-like superfamily)
MRPRDQERIEEFLDKKKEEERKEQEKKQCSGGWECECGDSWSHG